jgi:hypothetical protein
MTQKDPKGVSSRTRRAFADTYVLCSITGHATTFSTSRATTTLYIFNAFLNCLPFMR